MNRITIFLLVSIVLAALAGCGVKAEPSEAVLTGIIFDRGHGSAWGIQFYINIDSEEIISAQYFPKDSDAFEQNALYNVPITKEQWQSIETAVEEILPQLSKVESPSFFKQLLGAKTMVLDGGLYRKLTLVFQNGEITQEIEYQWPTGQQGDRLEQLLEDIANTVGNENTGEGGKE